MTPHERLPSGRQERGLMGRPFGVGKGQRIPAPWREGQRFRRVRVPPYSMRTPSPLRRSGRDPWRFGKERTFLGKVLSQNGEKGTEKGSIPGCTPFVRPPRGPVPFFGRGLDTPKKGNDPIPLRRDRRSPLWRQTPTRRMCPLRRTTTRWMTGPAGHPMGPTTSDGPDALSLCTGPRCTPRTSQVRVPRPLGRWGRRFGISPNVIYGWMVPQRCGSPRFFIRIHSTPRR